MQQQPVMVQQGQPMVQQQGVMMVQQQPVMVQQQPMMVQQQPMMVQQQPGVVMVPVQQQQMQMVPVQQQQQMVPVQQQQMDEPQKPKFERQGVPSSYTKCGFCACRFCQCKQNIGFCCTSASFARVCCFSVEMISCQPYGDDEPTKCCILNQQTCYCMKHNVGLYDIAMEGGIVDIVFSMCCMLDTVYNMAPDPDHVEDFKVTMPPDENLNIWSAMCCCISNYYCKLPECFGCTGSTTACCMDHKCVAGQCCGESRVCNAQKYDCLKFKCQYLSQFQCCCFDTRSYCPCDIKHPCIFALLCITCCVNGGWNCGFCMSYKTAVEANPKAYCGDDTAVHPSNT